MFQEEKLVDVGRPQMKCCLDYDADFPAPLTGGFDAPPWCCAVRRGRKAALRNGWAFPYSDPSATGSTHSSVSFLTLLTTRLTAYASIKAGS